jgi:hypothetical protein
LFDHIHSHRFVADLVSFFKGTRQIKFDLNKIAQCAFASFGPDSDRGKNPFFRKGSAGSSPAIGTKILRGKRLLDLIQEPFPVLAVNCDPMRSMAIKLDWAT